MKKATRNYETVQQAGVNPMAGCLPVYYKCQCFMLYFKFSHQIKFETKRFFLGEDDLSSLTQFMNYHSTYPTRGNHISLFPILSIAIFFYMTTGDSKCKHLSKKGMPDMAKIMKIMVYISPL
jgi:YidC/Oxa1 family membrane protein insertase